MPSHKHKKRLFRSEVDPLANNINELGDRGITRDQIFFLADVVQGGPGASLNDQWDPVWVFQFHGPAHRDPPLECVSLFEIGTRFLPGKHACFKGKMWVEQLRERKGGFSLAIAVLYKSVGGKKVDRGKPDGIACLRCRLILF